MYGSQAAVVATFLHLAAAVLPVLATQMNSVLAEWAVSRCLRKLGQITVESRSGRVVLSLLLTPVLSLAARVVAELLVASELSAVWMGFSERDHLAAVFTTGDIAARSHKPVHLQIGSAQEVIEPPCALNTVGVALGEPRALCET